MEYKIEEYRRSSLLHGFYPNINVQLYILRAIGIPSSVWIVDPQSSLKTSTLISWCCIQCVTVV